MEYIYIRYISDDTIKLTSLRTFWTLIPIKLQSFPLFCCGQNRSRRQSPGAAGYYFPFALYISGTILSRDILDFARKIVYRFNAETEEWVHFGTEMNFRIKLDPNLNLDLSLIILFPDVRASTSFVIICDISVIHPAPSKRHVTLKLTPLLFLNAKYKWNFAWPTIEQWIIS